MKTRLINFGEFGFIPLALHYLKVFADSDPRLADSTSIEIIERPDMLELVATPVDVFGFSCYVWNTRQTLDFCRILKNSQPGVKIVLGGPDVTPVAEDLLARNPAVDVIVCGEGEITFRDLLVHWSEAEQAPGSLEKIPGLCIRRGDEIHRTPPRDIIEDLDIIPSPYGGSGSIDLRTESRTILYETYRGCPFKCSFCYYPKDFGNLIHSFSMHRVESDLKEILSSGVSDLLLMDPTFNVPPRRAKNILRLIAGQPHHPNLCLSTELRVDLLDDEMIDLLNDARIRNIEIGLQSANAEVLKTIDRRQDLDRITKNAATIKARQMHLVVQLILGLPGETWESFLNSVEYAVSLNPNKIEIYRLQLLPGTPMYRDAQRLGLEFIDVPPRTLVRSRTMSAEDLERGLAFYHALQFLYNKRHGLLTLKWLARRFHSSLSAILLGFLDWIDSGGGADAQATAWRQEPYFRIPEYAAHLQAGHASPQGDVPGVVEALLDYERCLRSEERLGQESDWEDIQVASFRYNIPAILGEMAAHELPAPLDTWMLFRPRRETAGIRTVFNGKALDRLEPCAITADQAARLEDARARGTSPSAAYERGLERLASDQVASIFRI